MIETYTKVLELVLSLEEDFQPFKMRLQTSELQDMSMFRPLFGR